MRKTSRSGKGLAGAHDAFGGQPCNGEGGVLQQDLLEADDALPRLQVPELEAELVELQHGASGPVRQCQFVQGDQSGGAKGMAPVLEGFIGHREIDIQQAGLDADIGLRGHVRHVGGQIDAPQVDGEIGFPGAGKGLDLPMQTEGGAVDGRIEVRIHEDIDPGGQVGEEGNGNIDIGDVMGLAPDVILELDFAMGKLDIVDREAEGFLGLRIVYGSRCLGIRGCWQQIGKIPAMVLVEFQSAVKAVQAELFDHRRPPEEGDGLQVDIELPEGGHAVFPVGFQDHHIADGRR